MIFALIAAVVLLIFLGIWWWDGSTNNISHQLKEKVHSFTPKNVDHAPAFKLWIENNLDDNPELKSWLMELSDDGFGALTLRVSGFTADLNIEMEWLLDNTIEISPKLKAACKAIIINYLGVCRQGIAEQSDITIFDTYHKLVTLTTDTRYLNLRRIVFARLASEGLVESIPTYDMIMASETQRQEMASAAIKGYAVKDWSGFTKILAESAKEANSYTTTPT